jgi:hypothetical protein
VTPWTPPPTSELTAADGRLLRYCIYGPPGGRPVISLAGTPGTRWERPDVVSAFEATAYEHRGGHDPDDATLRRILGWIADQPLGLG